MRRCMHCHKNIHLWQTYKTSKFTGKDYHTSCWDKRNTSDEVLQEVQKLNDTNSYGESNVPYINQQGAKNIGMLIILAVVLLGRFFGVLQDKGVNTGWVIMIIIIVAIVLYVVIKAILYYTSNKINSP